MLRGVDILPPQKITWGIYAATGTDNPMASLHHHDV
jgi:hypothetical protein